MNVTESKIVVLLCSGVHKIFNKKLYIFLRGTSVTICRTDTDDRNSVGFSNEWQFKLICVFTYFQKRHMLPLEQLQNSWRNRISSYGCQCKKVLKKLKDPQKDASKTSLH